jgi:hypothetical protein
MLVMGGRTTEIRGCGFFFRVNEKLSGEQDFFSLSAALSLIIRHFILN